MKKYILVSLIFFISCKKEAGKTTVQQEDVIMVELASASYKSMNTPIIASGLLSSKSEIKLAFKTGGMIKRIYVQEGQSVHSGQLLAELDLSEISAQVSQANIGLKKARRDLNRVKRMYADDAVTLTTVQDATSAFEVAKQSVQIASFNQKLSKIYAPSSGRILRKIAEQGELITPFAPAFIMGSGESAYIVNLGLSDKDLVKVKLGDKAQINLDAYPETIFGGKITQIAQAVNPATGTFEVEVQIEPQGKKLVSGFVAKAEIMAQSTQNSSNLSVPIEAIVEADKNKAFVYVPTEDYKTVRKVPIIIGKIIGNDVEIISGIVSGTAVVMRGTNFLGEGTKIKISQ